MADPLITVPVDVDTNQAEKTLDNFQVKARKSGGNTGREFGLSLGKGAVGAISAFGAVTVATVGVLTAKAIGAANSQENAVNALNRSLAASGQFSQKASEGLQSFASSLSDASVFGGDAILQNAALIQSLAKLDTDGLQRATKSAADLSSALGIGFEQASKIVANAANGNVAAFKKLGIEVQRGTTNSETFNNALTQLEQRFGGSSQSALNTFSGQITRTANAFGSILEGFGLAITKSPVLVGAISLIGDVFRDIGIEAAKLDFSKIISIENVVSIARAINDFVISPIIFASKVVEFLFNLTELKTRSLIGIIESSITGIDNLLQSIGINASEIFTFVITKIGEAFSFVVTQVGNLLGAIGIDDQFLARVSSGVDKFISGTSSKFQESAKTTKASFDDILSTSIFGNNSEALANLDVNLAATVEKIKAAKALVNAPQDDGGPNGSFLDFFLAGFEGDRLENETARLKAFADNAKALGASVKANLTAGVANGAGQAFAAFGRAVATGENALDAFAKAFLATVAQTAIQVGTSFILTGVGLSFLGDPRGPGLIAAGGALAAFGGLLAATTGGGGGASAGGGGGSIIGGESIIDPRTGIAAPQERVAPTTGVTINIQGDVFDSEETGLRISNILRDSSLNNNVRATVFV